MKNMFDCIPLDERDQPWSTVMTPLGLRRMLHLAYGFKNCPYHAQNIVNKMAISVGLCLVYIDDIIMKHLWHWNADQHVNHLRKLLQYCREKNMLLNPTKFYPFVKESLSFSIKRNFEGSKIGEHYVKKIVQFKKPRTVAEMKEFQGLCGYVSNYNEKFQQLNYWLNQLVLRTPEKRGALKWDEPASLAFEQIKYLFENHPLLHNATRDGEFMIKTDACMTGTGAVLYQKQKDNKTNEMKWVIIDMYSKQMPKQLRNAHSMVHEALAITQACQHWQHHLLKRKFIIFTDNQPISRLFTSDFRDLNEITQKQILRLRVAIAPFTYEIKHVKGVNNELADGLSRFTIRLINKTKDGIQADPDYTEEDTPLVIDAIKAITSPDTRVRELSESEIADIARISEQSNINSINYCINNDINALLNGLPACNANDIASIQTEMFNTQLEQLRLNVPASEYTDISNLLCSAVEPGNLLNSDEYAFNLDIYNGINDIINDCLTIALNISNDTLQTLADITMETCDYCDIMAFDLSQKLKSEQWQCTSKSRVHAMKIENAMKIEKAMKIENPMKNDCNENNNINVISDKGKQAKINDKSKQLKRKQKIQRRHKMVLRSASNKIKANKVRRTDYVDPNFDDTQYSIKFRSELATNLFGHRNLTNIFNHAEFKQAQMNDTVIKLTMGIILRCEDKDEPIKRDSIDTKADLMSDDLSDKYKQIIKDVKILEKLDPWLAFKVQFGGLKVNDKGILVCEVWYYDEYVWSMVVPTQFIGKFMDYAHHNLQSHHLNWEQTFYNLDGYYWWSSMKKDIKVFCDRCLLCAYAKGHVKHIAPLKMREFVLPRQSLYADFIEVLGGKYHILTMVDYCTGWTMLEVCIDNDAFTVVDVIIRRWIPLHGQFKYFDSDRGSGFIGRVIQLLLLALNTDIQYAEANFHRSIGKVERVNRMVQNSFQKFNIQLNDKLVSLERKDPRKIINVLRTITPHIQAAINQRRPRISSYSPNMLMFGTRVKDISNIEVSMSRLNELYKNQKDFGITKRQDYEYVRNLLQNLKKIYKQYKSDWKDYTWLSRQSYNKRYNINENRLLRNMEQFMVGKEVLYFVGDKNVPNRKWLRKYTGPWKITTKLSDGTVIITDEKTNNQKRVSIDRLKLFDTQLFDRYINKFSDSQYEEYIAELKDILFKVEKPKNYNTKLDYREIRKNNL